MSHLKQYSTLSRREALKILAAVTGTTTLLTSPGHWEKPLVEVGVLPAFAQGSSLPALSCIEAGQGTGIGVMLALDTSGSISIQEEVRIQDLNNAKEAIKRYVGALDLNIDKVGLVSFGTSATLDQSLTDNSANIKAAIDSAFVGGLTDIAGALKLCGDELKLNGSQNNIPVIILLSDGGQTVPGDPVDEARKIKQDPTLKARGIRILTCALGNFADFATLQAIANEPGDFYYAPTSDDLITIFDPNCSL